MLECQRNPMRAYCSDKQQGSFYEIGIYRVLRVCFSPFPRFPCFNICPQSIREKSQGQPLASFQILKPGRGFISSRNKSILTHKVCGATKFIPPYAGGEGEKSFLDITALQRCGYTDAIRHSNATRLRGLRPGCSGTQACHAVRLELAHPRPGT